MLDPAEKKRLIGRLRRIEGQVKAIQEMVNSDAYCVDTLHQIAAARGALSKTGQIVLVRHIDLCVVDAFKSGSDRGRAKKLKELMEVFARYARLV